MAGRHGRDKAVITVPIFYGGSLIHKDKLPKDVAFDDLDLDYLMSNSAYMIEATDYDAYDQVDQTRGGIPLLKNTSQNTEFSLLTSNKFDATTVIQKPEEASVVTPRHTFLNLETSQANEFGHNTIGTC